MKRLALAIALVCVLSASAFAGDGHTVGEPAPGDTQGPSIAAPDDGNQGVGGFALMILDLFF